MKYILITLILFTNPSWGNPCSYIAPVVYASFKTEYYQALELNAETCSEENMKSPSCVALKEKFHVDLNKFFKDEKYRIYIKNLSHDPIYNASTMAEADIYLMLDELDDNLKETAKDEIQNLGKKATINTLKKSLTRLSNFGLCD